MGCVLGMNDYHNDSQYIDTCLNVWRIFIIFGMNDYPFRIPGKLKMICLTSKTSCKQYRYAIYKIGFAINKQDPKKCVILSNS